MPDINKPTYREELITVWRPHRDAVSLLGDGYAGSTLTPVIEEKYTRHKVKELHRKKERDWRTYAAAKRDFQRYTGQ